MAVTYQFEDFELNFERLELRRAGSLVRADALVVRLLGCLARNAGRLVTKDELVDEVWEGRAIADNAITVSMARLRKAIGQVRGRRELIETVYGRGYRLRCAVTLHEVQDDSPPLVRRAQDHSPLFVGRDRVVGRLHDALRRARDGRGRACVLLGEPGIGKTCTAEVFARDAAAGGVSVAWGYCREAGDTPPLSPWLRVLREMLERPTASGLVDGPGSEAAELFALCSAERTASTCNAVVSHAPVFQGTQRHRTFDRLVRAFTLAAERGPWLVLIEDLHRADAASLELFGYLLDELPRSRLMIVATARPPGPRRTGAPTSPLTQVIGHAHCERIALDRLQLPDVKAYVHALLDGADERLTRAVFKRSEGNPFFMVELARQLRSAGQRTHESLKIPDAALDLIWQRFAQLEDGARGLLSAAAVLGRSFELSRLQALTQADTAELMTCLDEALASELLIAAPDSTTGFAFGHELFRAALYDALSASERRSWHLKVVEMLEGRGLVGEAVPPSELAYHSHAALPRGDARRAVDHACAAAEAAAMQYAGRDVVRYLRYALEALELVDRPSPRLRMNLLFSRALYARACNPQLYVHDLAEVLRLAREQGDGPMLVRAARLLNVHPGYKPLRGSTAALEHALEILPPEESGARAVALAALACSAPGCYSAQRVHALLDEAVPLARASGSPVAQHATLVRKLWTLGGPAEPDDSEELACELEGLARRHLRFMPVLPVDLAMFRAFKAMQRGDQPAIVAALDRATATIRTIGEGEWAWHIARAAIVARINRGDAGGALDALAALHREAEARSILGTGPFVAFDRAVIARELNGSTTLEDWMVSELGFDDSEPPSIWSMKIRALVAAGLTQQARVALGAVPSECIADLPLDVHYLGTLGNLARAAIELGELDHCEALYVALEPFESAFAVHVSVWCEGSVAQLLGGLARALGFRERAVAHLERAVRANDRAGFALCAAESRVELARCLLAERGGRRATHARELAREAQATTRRLGAHRITLEAADVAEVQPQLV